EGDVIHFSGEIDEVTVWHRALSRQEIRRLMYQSPAPTESGLAAYWPMDDDDGGARVRDATPYGHDGRGHVVTRAPASRPRGPAFRDTIAFYLLMALLAAALFYAALRLYGLRLRRQKRALETQVAERTAALVVAQAGTARALDPVAA